MDQVLAAFIQLRDGLPEWDRAQREYWRDAQLKHRYGMTPEEYQLRLTRQKGLCAACGKPLGEGKRQRHVDHDHETGRIRGIIHNGCNLGIGHAADSPTVLRAWADYLETR